MRGNTFLTAAVFAGVTDIGLAVPTDSPSKEPCADISSRQQAAAASGEKDVMIDADLAMECLSTVPLGKKEAIELVDSIEPYLEWLSDAAYKKDPPPNYGYPGFDVFGNLAKVRSNLEADRYDGEYAFQEDLFKTVFLPGADSHFIFLPDVVSRSFRFGRANRLVSISEDGISLPQIKVASDVLANHPNASTVKTINGVDAVKFIEESGNAAPLHHDVDATYNSQFESRSKSAIGRTGFFAGDGRQGFMYQGPNTTLTFANGNTKTDPNLALVIGDWSGVVDGPSYYKKFCTPATGERPSADLTGNPHNSTAVKGDPGAPSVPAGYPKPRFATTDGLVTGYYMTGQDVNDVAVLSVLSFMSAPQDFQTTVADFLRDAKREGKRKLVVDLQENNGGRLLLAHDLFGQLFPSIVHESTFRYKESRSFMAVAAAISDSVKDVDVTTSDDALLISTSTTISNFRNDLNISNQNFATFDDKFSPHVFKDTPYTSLMRYNLSDALSTSNATFGLGITISGNGASSNVPQPFAAKDIVVLTDGACASACSVFGEMMRVQGGVKSVVFGGRPKNGPMQSIGGVKGSEVYSFDTIWKLNKHAEKYTNDSAALAQFARYNELPMQRSTESSVNARDQIQKANINDGTPSQFVTTMADCRLYWTAPMINDVTEIWKAGANAAFSGHQCAHGGIGRGIDGDNGGGNNNSTGSGNGGGSSVSRPSPCRPAVGRVHTPRASKRKLNIVQ